MERSTDRQPPRLAVCYGTRPQIIKASVLVETFAERWNVITVDTGQHFEHDVRALLYSQLGLRAPDYLLAAVHEPGAPPTESIRLRARPALEAIRPRAVVVIGDTNSTAGCAAAAADLGIPIVHVEAGVRAPGSPVAEEANRRAVDAASALLCAPSATAVANLARENVTGTTVLTGDIALDVLLRNLGRLVTIPGESWWPVTRGTPFILATLHRAELVESAELLRSVLGVIATLPMRVVLPVHPRLRAAIGRTGLAHELGPGVLLIPPLGYLETLACLREAHVVVTDSGGIQREAYWLGTPCVTVRDETEWMETVACGANLLVRPERVAAELPEALARAGQVPKCLLPPDRRAYGSGDAATRICEAVNACFGAPG